MIVIYSRLTPRVFVALTHDASSSEQASGASQVPLHQTQRNLMRSAEADEAPTHDNRETVVMETWHPDLTSGEVRM